MRGAVVLVGLLWMQVAATATTVIPPSFEQLVGESALVFEGDVIDVTSQWKGSGPEQTITTSVTFRVRQVLKGSWTPTVVLEFLGGTVGDRSLVVHDMPRFANGDHDILFVSAGTQQVSPIVGFSHGRFRIANSAAGDERVHRFDGAPIASPADIDPRRLRPPAVGPSISVAEFAGAITAEIARQARPGGR